jgi:6-phosphogluconolactonase
MLPLLAGLLLALPVPILKHAPKPDYFLYVGSAGRQGILLYRYHSQGPALTPQSDLAAALPGINYLTPHPSNKFLYAVTAQGTLTAFAVHKDSGALRLLNTVESPKKEPCFAAAEKKGWMLMVSYCGEGAVESFGVAGDGSIGASTGVQQVAGVRNIAISPDNSFVFFSGLDKVMQFRFDPARVAFWPNDPPAAAWKTGARPGTVVFLPDERFAYVSDGAGVSTFAYDREKGTLRFIDLIAMDRPVGMDIDPAGRFIYVANANKITVLALDHKRGTAKVKSSVETGGTQVAVDPTGRYLFVLNRGISVLGIDPKTGALTPTSLHIDVPDATCFRFVPIFVDGIH